MRYAALLLVFLGPGCQDSTTGIQALCNAPRDCAECQGVKPTMVDEVMARHINRSVRHEDARTLFEKLSKLDDRQRAKLLREAAKKEELSSCILADRYDARAQAWEAHQKGEGAELPPEK